MTKIGARSAVVLTRKNLSAVKTGWWVLFVTYVVFIFFSFWNDRDLVSKTPLERVSYFLFVIQTIIYLTLAVALFRKKSNDWSIIPVTVLFFTLDCYANELWVSIIKYTWLGHMFSSDYQDLMALLFALPFNFFTYLVVLGVFLTFPGGIWRSRGDRKIFWWTAGVLMLFVPFMFAGLYTQDPGYIYWFEFFGEQFIQTFIFLLAGYKLFKHYRTSHNAIQRQQIKWIVVFFSMRVWVYFLYLLSMLAGLVYYVISSSGWNNIMTVVENWYVLLLAIADFGLVIAFSFSIFRYRLWDIEILINRAVVYSILTGMLGVLGAVSLAVLNYLIRRWFGDDSSLWAVIISVLPVAAAFNPIRDRVQELVDRYFKPEEVDFEHHFLEFRADIRDMLGTSRIIDIISRQVKKQLNVDFACIYLADEHDKIPSFSLSDESLKTLATGELVVGKDGKGYSLLIPLVVSRPVVPDFLGIIVLGRRLNGRGYSTPILNSLKTLGANAGEAIYLSQLSEQSNKRASTVPGSALVPV